MRLLVAVLAVLAGLMAAPMPAQASDQPHDRANRGASRAIPSGQWIVDGSGRVLVLHGLNMVYKRAPYAPDHVGFGRDDARFLARQGFTTVRLGLIWKAVEPQPGVYDDAYLARIRSCLLYTSPSPRD